MQVTIETGLLIGVSSAMTAILTLLALRKRDRHADEIADRAKSKQEGIDKERLDNVVADVEQIQKTDLPRLERLVSENSLAVSGLATTTTVQAANVDQLVEKIDDLRDLHKERQQRFDALIDALLQEKKKG